MVNVCEPLINLVIVNRHKMLTRRSQNGTKPVNPLLDGVTLTSRLPGDRWHLRHEQSFEHTELGKPVMVPSGIFGAGDPQGELLP